MKTITLEQLLNLQYMAFTGKLFNEYNIYLFKRYNEFFKEIGSNLTVETLINSEINDYSNKIKIVLEMVECLVKTNSNQDSVKNSLSTFDIEDLIVVLNENNFQKETFYINEDTYKILRDSFIFAYDTNREQHKFVIKKRNVAMLIPDEHIHQLDKIHKEIINKRWAMNCINSFLMLREYFDVEDEELGLV
ncbi:MAG: hypothetical protein CL760_09000 [Chloroflexi bacterium]|nr:hypothetical protein [Chloroflexota bacterium]|tara:strand:- start:46325 stop:46897 length:573 start_codon:yes stop_codon:yes gene_type:complete